MMKQAVVPGGKIDVATKEEVAELLRDYSQAEHVAFGGDSIERIQRDWPVKGHRRRVRVNASRGSDNFVVPAATFTDLLPEEHGRGGLSIINVGINPCFVYLADAATAQARGGNVASGWLSANGGSWDGEISDFVWVGPVSVRSVAGTTLVWAAV